MNSIYRQVKQSGVAAIALTMLAVVILLAGIAIPVQAQTETVLYSFQGTPSSGPDGAYPQSGPILKGTTLYGTAPPAVASCGQSAQRQAKRQSCTRSKASRMTRGVPWED
jgi:hypothetical protein